MQPNTTTPMMAQWHACKQRAGSAVLLFRMGDFYEAFYDDAVLIAKELDLTLTSRQEIPMAGVPYHTSEGYIDKLVSKGHRVAVAEQTEDPKKAKGIVKREVVRIVTPGTVINSSLLSDKSNNFFVSLTRVNALIGLASLDLTTGEFRIIEFDKEQDLLNEIYKLRPSEFLTSKKFQAAYPHLFEDLRKSYDFMLNVEDDWKFDHELAQGFLTQHFKVHHLEGFGLKGMVAAINAAGALLRYLQETLSLPIEHIAEIHPYSTSQYMSLDRMTQRNLELTTSLQDGSRKNTLLGILDKTLTPMGGRLMHHWVKQPLLQESEIKKRQDAIQTFLQKAHLMDQLASLLEQVRDLERLMMKVCSGYASPRDISGLRFSYEPVPQLKLLLQHIAPESILFQRELEKLQPLPEMVQLIARALVDDPPARLTDGNIFRDGFNGDLDELRQISHSSKNWLANYQNKLREDTQLKSLKVGYNKMFGYFIEVSRGQAERVPDSFQRRQTLVNAERFITPELKEYETKVLTAEERISSIENELFNALRLEVAKFATPVLRTAQAIAQIDCLYSLAEVARTQQYCRPVIDESRLIDIKGGRHPIIEIANSSERFVPNDTLLNDDNDRLLLITGPNMAGKSTYIRQVALITIMAQMGSYVPAASAHIGLVDKVFTRIGASDDLTRGHSTFMVEMTETANILHNATSRSLVILDEIGRGTSTYDGISIAWSVAEYLLITDEKKAKTLFATHYWELTKLEEKIPGAVNYNIAVHESEDHIVFLRKIVRGGTDKSYGIHVGRLAGLPLPVIERAKEILIHLEENANRKSAFEPSAPKRKPKASKNQPTQDFQLSFFSTSILD